MSYFDDYLFSLPQDWDKHMDFLKFFLQVKIRYLRQPFGKFSQQSNEHSKNEF